MPVGECLTDIPTGATRIGDILGMVITTIITIRAFMRAITDIITTDTDTTIVLTVITQWTTTECMQDKAAGRTELTRTVI